MNNVVNGSKPVTHDVLFDAAVKVITDTRRQFIETYGECPREAEEVLQGMCVYANQLIGGLFPEHNGLALLEAMMPPETLTEVLKEDNAKPAKRIKGSV